MVSLATLDTEPKATEQTRHDGVLTVTLTNAETVHQSRLLGPLSLHVAGLPLPRSLPALTTRVVSEWADAGARPRGLALRSPDELSSTRLATPMTAAPLRRGRTWVP